MNSDSIVNRTIRLAEENNARSFCYMMQVDKAGNQQLMHYRVLSPISKKEVASLPPSLT
jgi:hypothetical protein